MTKMKKGSYAKIKERILSKVNLNEVNLSELHYNRLIREACLKETNLERRLSIREELKVIRLLRKDKYFKIGV